MFSTIEEIAVSCPAVRRFAEQGFQLSRPVLSLELELGFDIETQSQRLRLSDFGASMRSVAANPTPEMDLLQG